VIELEMSQNYNIVGGVLASFTHTRTVVLELSTALGPENRHFEKVFPSAKRKS
jgi:hypothetical protein